MKEVKRRTEPQEKSSRASTQWPGTGTYLVGVQCRRHFSQWRGVFYHDGISNLQDTMTIFLKDPNFVSFIMTSKFPIDNKSPETVEGGWLPSTRPWKALELISWPKCVRLDHCRDLTSSGWIYERNPPALGYSDGKERI